MVAAWGGELLGCSRAGTVRVGRWCAVCGPGVCVLGSGRWVSAATGEGTGFLLGRV